MQEYSSIQHPHNEKLLIKSLDDYEKDLAGVNKFITAAKQYGHYDKVISPPDRFKNWRDDCDLMSQYSDWICTESGTPSLKLDIPDLPVNDILNESLNAAEYYAKQRDHRMPGWYSMAIHAQANNMHYTDHPKNYPSDAPQTYGWTPLADKCPITTEWFKDVWPWSPNLTRIRFMLLKPGGYIRVHSDTGKGNWELLNYNIAITNPETCWFAQEQANTIPWEPGDIRLIDVGRDHCVYNESNQERLHMIVLDYRSRNKESYICNGFDKLLKLIK